MYIRPFILYGSEKIRKTEEKFRLEIFEEKILMRIYDSETGEWKI